MSDEWKCAEMEYVERDGVEVQDWLDISGAEIYSAGKLVTYHVDTGTSYQEKVRKGQSCLSPTTFAPAKSGWTFCGWRTDSTASGEVLSEKVMERDPISLYAVFRQAVTLSYNGNGASGGSTASQSGYRYYNCGNVVNPSFALRGCGYSKTHNRFRYWNLGGTQYSAGSTVTLSASQTAYAVWQAAVSAESTGRTQGDIGTFRDGATITETITYPAFLEPPTLTGEAAGTGWWEDKHSGSTITFRDITTTSATCVYSISSNSGNNYNYATWVAWKATGLRWP